MSKKLTVKELNDVMVHWQGWEDRDYEIHLWDPYMQRQVYFTFCGCSHPDKTVNFIVTGYDDSNRIEGGSENLPTGRMLF